MLFSGGGSAGGTSRPKKEEKKEKKSEKGKPDGIFATLPTRHSLDDKYEVQEAVFIRWANSLFENATITELRDLADLKFLSSFASLITGTSSVVSVFVMPSA